MVTRFFFLGLFFLSVFAVGQIAVTNAPPFNNAENIVNDLLLGDDLETSNWSWQNGATNIGYFDGFASNIGFDEGVIMCTGGIDFVTTGAGAGPGISGDADLETALSALGMSGFSVNSLGFAGYLLATKDSDLNWLIAHGPETLLEKVVY